MDKNARIFVTGHRGMVGSAVVRRLQAGGYDKLLLRTHAEPDLLDQRAVFDFLADHKPDYVFIARSDIDIAVAARHALTPTEKIALVEALAEATGRPVDLVDPRVVAEPLLGQIVRHGRRLLGSDNSAYGELISRHLFEQADFMPYRTRVLAERRAAWIGK